MAEIKGTILSAPISPGDTSSSFPTHIDIYGQGGLMTVSTLSELESIPLARQKQGMIVYVSDINTYYRVIATGSPLTNVTPDFTLNNVSLKNSLSAQGTITSNTLNQGLTNTVVTHSAGTLQQRTINSRVWDTAATFLSGSPTTNRLARTVSSNTLGDSIITDTGTRIGINTTNPGETLTVVGNISATGIVYGTAVSNNSISVVGNVTATGSVIAAGNVLAVGALSGASLAVGGNIVSSGTLSAGNIPFGSTDNVITHSSGAFQQRTINSRAWDTNATFLTGSPTINSVLKLTNTNTIGNSIITDTGTSIGIKTNTPNKDVTVNGEISANNTIYDGAGNSIQWNQAHNISTIYQSTSSSFATNTTLNSVSSQLVTNTTLNSISSQLVTNTAFTNYQTNYQTNVASSTAILLPITTYQNASASFVRQGGNTLSQALSVGTTDNQHLILETGNVNRVTVLSSGQIGVGTSNPTQTLTVVGNISATGLIYGTNVSNNVDGSINLTGNLSAAGTIASGTLNNGSTNTVVTHSSGTLEQRTINNRVWDTAATFLSGSPTTNTVLKLTNTNTVGNSIITDTGTNVGINTASPNERLTVSGNISATGNVSGATLIVGAPAANKATLTLSTLAAARSYNLPEVGANADFVMTAGTQTIAGQKTFSNGFISTTHSFINNAQRLSWYNASGAWLAGSSGASITKWSDNDLYIDNYDGSTRFRLGSSFTDILILSAANNTSVTPSVVFPTGNIGIGNYIPIPGQIFPAVTLHMAGSGANYQSPSLNNNPTLQIRNTALSATGHAILLVRTTGLSSTGQYVPGGDPFVSYDISGVSGWSTGIDNSDDKKFKIANSWSDVGTNTFMTITTAGRVGIGTSAPTRNLVLSSGSVAMGADISSTFSAGFETGAIGTLTNHPFHLMQFGSSRARIGSSTFVIGDTTTDDAATPLECSKSYAGATLTHRFANTDTTSDSASRLIISTGLGSSVPGSEAEYYVQQASGAWLGTNSSHSLSIKTANTLRMRFNNAGGIFIATASLPTGSTNTVITHSSGTLQQRTINPVVWDSADTFVKSSYAGITGGYLFRQTPGNTAPRVDAGALFDSGSAGSTTGNIGIQNTSPSATLTVGTSLAGTAASTTFTTNAGSLGTTAGTIVKLANFGCNTGNVTSLGLKSLRTTTGTDWQSTAFGLTFDVDNTSPVNNSQIWMLAGGGLGVGASPTAVGTNKVMISGGPVSVVKGTQGILLEPAVSDANTSDLVFYDPMVAAFRTGRIDGSVVALQSRVTGNVGIGTSNPTDKLHVIGTSRFGGNVSSSGNLSIGGSITPSTGSFLGAGIEFAQNPGGGSGDIGYIRHYVRNAMSESTTLEIGNQNDVDDHIFLNPSGNVGIGTSTPAQKLTISGNIGIGAGSATIAPIQLTAGPRLTTPATGAVEYDGPTAYVHSTAFGSRASVPLTVYTTGQGPSLTLLQESLYQNIFPAANDTITLAAGTYQIELAVSATRGAVSTASSTLRTIFAGTAVGSFIGELFCGMTSSASHQYASVSIASLNTAIVGLATSVSANLLHSHGIKGILRITTAGTFIPQYSMSANLVGATTQTVTRSSNYCIIKCIDSTPAPASGPGAAWS